MPPAVLVTRHRVHKVSISSQTTKTLRRLFHQATFSTLSLLPKLVLDSHLPDDKLSGRATHKTSAGARLAAIQSHRQ